MSKKDARKWKTCPKLSVCAPTRNIARIWRCNITACCSAFKPGCWANCPKPMRRNSSSKSKPVTPPTHRSWRMRVRARLSNMLHYQTRCAKISISVNKKSRVLFDQQRRQFTPTKGESLVADLILPDNRSGDKPPQYPNPAIDFNAFLRWEAKTRDTLDIKKTYIDMAGDLVAGVLLSQIVYWYLPSKDGKSKITIHKNEKEWIAKSRHELWDECRVSPKQVDRALRELSKA